MLLNTMNLKRAIWVGILIYVVSFILRIIVTIILGLGIINLEINPTQTEISNIYFFIYILIILIITTLFTLYYFKDRKIKPSAKEGFFFGVILIILGFILDIINFSILAAVSDSNQSTISHYSNPLFWLELVLFLVVTTVIGAIKQKKK